jgi:hypothetical protein
MDFHPERCEAERPKHHNSPIRQYICGLQYWIREQTDIEALVRDGISGCLVCGSEPRLPGCHAPHASDGCKAGEDPGEFCVVGVLYVAYCMLDIVFYFGV